MQPTAIQSTDHPAAKSFRLENCEAVMVAIGPTRYAIIRRDDAQRMVPVERICKRIRDLQPGDQVVYNGHRETVYGLCEY